MPLKNPFTDIKQVKQYFPILYGVNDTNDAYQQERYLRAFSEFKRIFGAKNAYICSSSGRVELLGNHTDHNGGKVLSTAISLDTLAFFLPNGTQTVDVFSEGYGKITVNLSDDNGIVERENGTTVALLRGVAKSLEHMGFTVGGFNAYITSTVLNGAGISSSAAFEVLICEIFNFLFNDGKITCEQKAIAAQYAENIYFGKPCGLLDQTAISYGGLKKLDFKDKNKINVADVDGNLDDYTLILINTGGSHENLTDEYAAIPAEMKSVAAAFGKERLIDLDENEFYDEIASKNLSDRAVCRAIHFYNENKRVDTAQSALKNNDLSEFLNCVRQSGISSMCKLQNCYVAGSPDQSIPKALFICERFLNGGANRVHGGGFAGTILNIVKNNYVSDFIAKTNKLFGAENVIPLKVRKIGTIVL